jgi:hypothetical protein
MYNIDKFLLMLFLTNKNYSKNRIQLNKYTGSFLESSVNKLPVYKSVIYVNK